MKTLIKYTALLASTLLAAACGSSPDLKVETPPEERTYTVVDLYYQPNLQAACGDLDLQAPKFSFDSAELSPADRTEMSKLAQCIKRPALSDETLYVVGHTDPRGTESYNRDLGKERAEAVKNALVAHGIAADRIMLESRGEADATMRPWDWPQQRRVDIGITDGGQWTFVETEITEKKAGKVVPGEFDEKADVDGDGVDEPTVYPKSEKRMKASTRDFSEKGDPDNDGADEPEK